MAHSTLKHLLPGELSSPSTDGRPPPAQASQLGCFAANRMLTVLHKRLSRGLKYRQRELTQAHDLRTSNEKRYGNKFHVLPSTYTRFEGFPLC